MPIPPLVVSIGSFLGVTGARRLAVQLGISVAGGVIANKISGSGSELGKGLLPIVQSIDEFHKSFLTVMRQRDAAPDIKARNARLLEPLESLDFDGLVQRFEDLEARTAESRKLLKGSLSPGERAAITALNVRDNRSLDEVEKRSATEFKDQKPVRQEVLHRGILKDVEAQKREEAERKELLTTTMVLGGSFKDLEATLGAEDGLLGSFQDLDAALKDGGLLGALAKLAEAVEIAAARIAAAVNAPAPTGGGVRRQEAASGGTVTAGQPVLVGERGPEIFIPGSAGHIVNAFDAAAGEGASMGARGTAGASSQTAVEREIIATLQDLDETLADLDEAIRQAEDAGILGASGRSSSSGRFGTSGSAKDPISQIDEALRLVESTGGAFEDMGRVLEQLEAQGKKNFEGIALAADEVRGASDMRRGASDDHPDTRIDARNECDEWEDWKLAA